MEVKKEQHNSNGRNQEWTTLEHNGLIFPPPYKPHGVKMFYDGQIVHLTTDQEEVASLYALLLDTHYVKQKTFNENFFGDWKKLLGRDHFIKELDKCDFTPIHRWLTSEKMKMVHRSFHERAALIKEKRKENDKYMPIVDGIQFRVLNLKAPTPSLFRGRENDPKMGKLTKRIYPSDVIINIGKDVPVPESPVPGHSWKEVRHDNSVKWIACWDSQFSHPGDFMYVYWDIPRYNPRNTVQNHKNWRTVKDCIGYAGKETQLSDGLSDLRYKIARWQASDEKTLSTLRQALMSDALKVTSKRSNDQIQTDTADSTLGLESLDISDWEIVEKEDSEETTSDPMITNE